MRNASFDSVTGGAAGWADPADIVLTAVDDSGIEVVSFFAVLGEVESVGFLLGRDAQADDLVDDEEQDQCADDGDAPGDGDAGELVEQLAPVAVDGAGGQRVPDAS